MVWVQGEQDTNTEANAQAYGGRLTTFISDIRATYGAALPFFFSRLSAQQTYYPTNRNAAYLALRQSQQTVAANVSGAYLVDIDGPSFTVAGDGVHFDANGQQALGAAFAAKLADVISMLTPIEYWRQFYFGNATVDTGNSEDFNHNGISNLLEFAFGTNPVNSTAAALLYNGTLAGGGTITATGQPTLLFESIPTGVDFRALFVRRDDYVAAGLTYTVQFSPDLSVWTPSIEVPTVLADNGTHQIVSVPFPGFLNGKKARFFRVQVTLFP
jgi:hypothetical protein